MTFREEYDSAKALIENSLAGYFTGSGLEEAMRYSLMAGGKRIRPVLTVKFCEAGGGTIEDALSFACGVEMLHTYSLIHDDLPCMDNDDLRRGMPTCHKVYGECIATLAGDALQAAAFSTVLTADISAEARANAAAALAEAAGEKGMCAGQYADTLEDGKLHTLDELTEINDKKTGALLRAACVMGVYAACGNEGLLNSAREYAVNLGLAFQIRDDVLDVVSTVEELGKPINSDADNKKSTYVSLLGIDECQKQVRLYTEKAKAALSAAGWPDSTEFLCKLADSLVERKY